jgi:uncharacterized membrane protein
MTLQPAIRRLRPALVALVAMMLALVLLPSRAWADGDYSIDNVDIDATVASDGSVSVRETREFNFDGSFHGVYWDIPTGDESSGIGTTIGQVGLQEGDQFIPFTESGSGEDGTYTVTREDGYLEVKIYSAHEDESASFTVNYTDTNLATRWEDTGELYWKFVSDGWQVESQNVTCSIHLPVPSGTTVTPGSNVRAWGHGPLDAYVDVGATGTVTYSVPGVGTSEYAEARIVFPQEWLSQEAVTQQKRLDTVLSEEQQWADEANAQRERARLMGYVALAVFVTAGVASVVVAVLRRRKYVRDHTPQFDDKYFRDVPTKDHPAVLGALLNGGKPTQDDFTASLMRLSDLGLVKLEQVKLTKKRILLGEKTVDDYRLTRLDGPAREQVDKKSARIDDAVLDFLFETVASNVDGAKPHSGELYFSDIESVAKENPELFSDKYKDWEDTVEGVAIQRGFYVDPKATSKVPCIALFVLDVLLVFIDFFLMVIETVTVGVGMISLLALAVGAIASVLAIKGMKELSPEAIETTAKLEALRRWLKDFTRLEEAVPRDVVLWNRLLVMAVVLGVADEVVKQLKVAVPEVVSDPGFMPVYGWYYYSPSIGTPATAFANAAASAHKVTAAALSESSNSSGGGFSGGFSGGGGGGFGGGGGGGAF